MSRIKTAVRKLQAVEVEGNVIWLNVAGRTGATKKCRELGLHLAADNSIKKNNRYLGQFLPNRFVGLENNNFGIILGDL
jgi:hypothetical protein